jgi:hypothetical protein
MIWMIHPKPKVCVIQAHIIFGSYIKLIMKKQLFILCSLYLVLADQLLAQTFDCSSLSITNVYADANDPNTYWISVLFDGTNSGFINYPYPSFVTAANGDTLATGTMFYFGQIGGTTQDYPVTVQPGASLDAFTAQFVFSDGDFVSANDTCYLTFPSINQVVAPCEAAALWSCWPNPVKDIVHLQAHPKLWGTSFEIHSAMGQLVRSGSLHPHTMDIAVEALPAGVYLLTARDARIEPLRFCKE